MNKDKIIENGYKLIPMSEITDEARQIAVAWMECEDKDWIGQKHKLASDIMNYAKKYHIAQLKAEAEKEELKEGWKELENSGLDKPFNPTTDEKETHWETTEIN